MGLQIQHILMRLRGSPRPEWNLVGFNCPVKFLVAAPYIDTFVVLSIIIVGSQVRDGCKSGRIVENSLFEVYVFLMCSGCCA